jgi:Zn-dependent M32 family carboxypeptidase
MQKRIFSILALVLCFAACKETPKSDAGPTVSKVNEVLSSINSNKQQLDTYKAELTQLEQQIRNMPASNNPELQRAISMLDGLQSKSRSAQIEQDFKSMEGEVQDVLNYIKANPQLNQKQLDSLVVKCNLFKDSSKLEAEGIKQIIEQLKSVISQQ